MNTPTLLIIEDDDLQYELYEEALSRYGLARARSGSEALARLAELQPDALILDHVLDAGERGLDFLPGFKALLPHVPVIVVSGALEVRQQLAALQGPRRAHFCLPKPVDLVELQHTVATALAECGPTEVVRRFEALERSRRADAMELFSRSTDRLSRQHRLRQQLRDATERPSISALARQYGVARRTILRDLQEMIRRGEIEAGVYPDAHDSVAGAATRE